MYNDDEFEDTKAASANYNQHSHADYTILSAERVKWHAEFVPEGFE